MILPDSPILSDQSDKADCVWYIYLALAKVTRKLRARHIFSGSGTPRKNLKLNEVIHLKE